MNIEITILDADEHEITMNLPSRKRVCPDCQGEGFVLCPGMRHHAYSEEEFAESFDEEEAAEYFRRGGRYDVKCPTCKGANVVDAVNVDACNSEERAHYETFLAQEREYAAWEREAEAERAMGA
jgi:hypothetical protein